MLRFFRENKNTIIAGSAGATKVLADNSWVWANTQMGTEGEVDASKYVWNVVLVLLAVGAWSMGGKAADMAKQAAASQPELSTFFARHRYKLTGGFFGMAFSMINNYWIFTGMPMPGSDIPEGVKKTLYCVAEMLAAAGIVGELGNACDHLQKLTSREGIELHDADYRQMDDEGGISRPSHR